LRDLFSFRLWIAVHFIISLTVLPQECIYFKSQMIRFTQTYLFIALVSAERTFFFLIHDQNSSGNSFKLLRVMKFFLIFFHQTIREITKVLFSRSGNKKLPGNNVIYFPFAVMER